MNTGTTGTTSNELKKKLNYHLKALHLTTMRNSYTTLCQLAVKESMSYEEFLLELLVQDLLVAKKELCLSRKLKVIAPIV